MLSKKQLENAATHQGYTTEKHEIAQTAITLLNMLLEVKNSVNYCPVCRKEIGHESDCELEKLMKEVRRDKEYDFIAVDFDGTLCVHRFPEIGEPKPGVIEYIKQQAEAGTKIILHTCRENDEPGGRNYLDEAVEW